MNAPFFQLDAAADAFAPAEICRVCPMIREGDFCGSPIHPDCLRVDTQGTVRVALTASPQRWFTFIAQLGEVFHLTSNPIGTLGQRVTALQFRLEADSPLPRNAPREYLPNLAGYASLWAIRESSPRRTRYGLEVRDASGMEFERIMLREQSNQEVFGQFVNNCQTPPEQAGSWFPPNHTASLQRCAQLAQRIRRLRGQWATGDRTIRRLPLRFVPKLLAAAARSSLPLCATYYHPALVRRVTWTPRTCADITRDGPERLCHGSDAGLLLDRRGAGSAWLWTGQCSGCSEQRWRIELGDGHDQLGLSLAAGSPAAEAEWRQLIKARLP
jgi:hypothetical protein